MCAGEYDKVCVAGTMLACAEKSLCKSCIKGTVYGTKWFMSSLQLFWCFLFLILEIGHVFLATHLFRKQKSRYVGFAETLHFYIFPTIKLSCGLSQRQGFCCWAWWGIETFLKIFLCVSIHCAWSSFCIKFFLYLPNCITINFAHWCEADSNRRECRGFETAVVVVDNVYFQTTKTAENMNGLFVCSSIEPVGDFITVYLIYSGKNGYWFSVLSCLSCNRFFFTFCTTNLGRIWVHFWIVLCGVLKKESSEIIFFFFMKASVIPTFINHKCDGMSCFFLFDAPLIGSNWELHCGVVNSEMPRVIDELLFSVLIIMLWISLCAIFLYSATKLHQTDLITSTC